MNEVWRVPEVKRVAKKAYTPGRAEAAKRPPRSMPPSELQAQSGELQASPSDLPDQQTNPVDLTVEHQVTPPAVVRTWVKSNLGAALSERIAQVVPHG